MGAVVAFPVGGAAGEPEAAAGSGLDRRGGHPELAAFAVGKEEFEIDRERHPEPVVGRRHQGDVRKVHVRLRFEAEPELAADAGGLGDRHRRVPPVAERAVMDEGEMRQVDEILQPAPGRGRPGVGLARDAAERLVAPGRAAGNFGAGLRIEAQPDQVVGDRGLDLPEPEAGRNFVARHRRDFDAQAAGVVEPAVIGAAQPARLHAADRQARRAVDAAVREGGDGAGDLGDGDRLPEQRDRERPVVGRVGGEFRQGADRMPEIAPRAVVEIGHAVLPGPGPCRCWQNRRQRKG